MLWIPTMITKLRNAAPRSTARRRLASVVLIFASLNLVACRAAPEIAQVAPTESPAVVASAAAAARATAQPAPSGEVPTSATAADAMPQSVWVKKRFKFDLLGDAADPRDAPDGAPLPFVELHGSVNRTVFYVIRDEDPATRGLSMFESGREYAVVGNTTWIRLDRVRR
ncbi:MAG: hypothetical protein K8T90_21135 [Planctomycetes bacterium]|nr:hypothetical protein [Planctomycetota bacterium]